MKVKLVNFLPNCLFFQLVVFFLLLPPSIPPSLALDIPLDLPENISTSRNVMTEALSAIQEGRLSGSAVLAKGRYSIKKKDKDYILETDVDSRVTFALGFQITAASDSGDLVVLTPRLTDLDFTFSPAVTVVTDKGLTARLEKVRLGEDRKKVQATVDVEITKSAASFFLKTFYSAGEEKAEPVSENWKKMFVQVALDQCRAGFKPGASFEFQGQKVVMGPGGQLALKDMRLSGQGMLEGRFEANIKLAARTALNLEKFRIQPESAEIVLNGRFTRKDKDVSLVLENPAGQAETNQLKISNAPLIIRNEQNREINLFLADGLFRITDFKHESSGDPQNGRTIVNMVSRLGLGQGKIPLGDGSMEFGAVKAHRLELFYDSTGPADKKLSLSLAPKIDFYQVILDVTARDKGRVKLNLDNLTAEGIKISGGDDLKLVCPANTVKPASLEFLTAGNQKIFMVFGPDSQITIGNDQPLVLKTGPDGQGLKSTLANIRISGRFPLVETDLSGKKLPLSDVRVDILARNHDRMAVTGTVDAVIKGSALAAQMGRPSGLGSEKLKIDDVKVSIPGDLYLRLGLDTVTRQNILQLELDEGVLVDFSGPGLKGTGLTGKARFSDIKTTLDLAGKNGPMTMTMQISSADTVCVYEWTKSFQPKVKRRIRTQGRTLSKPVYLNPFSVTIQLESQIELRDNQLVLKINKWRQTDNGRICIQAGGDGPALNSCIGVDAPGMTLNGNIRGHNFQKSVANPIKKQIDKLTGREFTFDLKR